MKATTTLRGRALSCRPFNADAVRLSDSSADREYSSTEIANTPPQRLCGASPPLVARARKRRYGNRDVTEHRDVVPAPIPRTASGSRSVALVFATPPHNLVVKQGATI